MRSVKLWLPEQNYKASLSYISLKQTYSYSKKTCIIEWKPYSHTLRLISILKRSVHLVVSNLMCLQVVWLRKGIHNARSPLTIRSDGTVCQAEVFQFHRIFSPVHNIYQCKYSYGNTEHLIRYNCILSLQRRHYKTNRANKYGWLVFLFIAFPALGEEVICLSRVLAFPFKHLTKY